MSFLIPHALMRRWLEAVGRSESADELAHMARRRVERFPIPVRWLHRLVVWFIEYLGPVGFLGRFRRASRLDAEDFNRLQRRLNDPAWYPLRGAFLLFRLPLHEVTEAEAPPSDYPHPLQGVKTDSSDSYDVVVIGSGAGGAPLAWALSRSGLRVAVIEAGSLPRPETTSNALEHYYLGQGMIVSPVGGLLPILAGHAVGGTTAINSGTCLRPSKDRLAAWDRQAGTDFSRGSLDPWMDQVERILGVGLPDRSLLSPACVLVETGFARLGRPDTYLLPRNAPSCKGSGRCCFVCPTGAKLSTDLGFLPQAVEAGCALFVGYRAEGLREAKDGIEVSVEGPEGKRILRGRELVLAAGALSTPGLIRKNHLGDHWRQSGRFLRVHPATKVFAHFRDPVHGERGIPQGIGYLAPELPRLAFEGIFTPRSGAVKMMPLVAERQRWWLERYEHVASFGAFVQDRSIGRVDMVGTLPVVSYRLHPQDARDLGAGILLIAEAWFAAGAERVLLPACGIPNELRTPDDLRKLAPEDFKPSQLLAGAFHPQGTAGIGRVVESDLALMGTSHIHVCDASVLPDSPGVNPQITIMALSLRLAERLARKLGANWRHDSCVANHPQP